MYRRLGYGWDRVQSVWADTASWFSSPATHGRLSLLVSSIFTWMLITHERILTLVDKDWGSSRLSAQKWVYQIMAL